MNGINNMHHMKTEMRVASFVGYVIASLQKRAKLGFSIFIRYIIQKWHKNLDLSKKFSSMRNTTLNVMKNSPYRYAKIKGLRKLTLAV